MLRRATENAIAGHIWPAGRYLPIPGLVNTVTASLITIMGQMTEMSQRKKNRLPPVRFSHQLHEVSFEPPANFGHDYVTVAQQFNVERLVTESFTIDEDLRNIGREGICSTDLW